MYIEVLTCIIRIIPYQIDNQFSPTKKWIY